MILSNRGSRLFRALVEVNPAATSKALSNVLSKCDEEQLSLITGKVRRNLIWALEKLCFHATCFEEAANSLLLLASSENENWSNNATGVFKQLFRTFLSGTEATPAVRMRLIDSALKSDQESKRKLAVEALDQAISTHSWGRTVGAEYQGSGIPLEEWRPKVWGEAFEYWEQAHTRLCNLVITKDPLALLAKDSIANHIRDLVQYGRVDLLDKIIKKIVEQDGPLWPSALESIKDSLRFEGGKIPDEGREKLLEWISLLTPNDLKDRLYLLVTKPPFEHVENEEGHFEDVAAKNAKLLAEELAPDIDSIIPLIDQLLAGEQRQAFWFGKNLIESAESWEPLLSEVIKKIACIEQPNINLLLGILNGIFNVDASAWKDIAHIFFHTENLTPYYADVIVTGKVIPEQLDSLVELLVEQKIEPIAASRFTYGSPLEHMDFHYVTQFTNKMTEISDDAAWVALDILSMFCFGDDKKWNNCKDSFREIVVHLRLDKERKKQSQLEIHHWKDVVKKLLQSEDAYFAIEIVKQILKGCTDGHNFSELWHYVQPIIRIIFQQYAKDVWPLFSEAIKNSDPLEEYRIMHLLDTGNSFDKKEPSVLSDLPDDLLKDWCLQFPETAPEFVARTIEILLEEEDRYKISPKAQFLLDNFGNNERVLSALSSNLSSFGWSGSLVPYLQKEIDALKLLEDHENQNVRDWVRRRCNYLSEMIERESLRDEEHDWGIY